MIVIAYDGSLKFDTKIDTAGFTKGSNTIKSQAGGLKKTLLGLGKVMLATFSVAALISFGKQAVETASDLVEVQNVVDTAFGDTAYKIEEFAETSIKNFGLSKLAAKQMASTYMAISTGMGQVADTASDMAVTITGRLGDVMSFYNKTQSEVDTIGKAIYTGETEPLKAIGVIMTETNLAAFALEKGFSKAYSEMAADEKLLVRQQYFLERTSLAAGDFVKTQDGWANQTRVLSEQFKEFLGIMGNGLIQVLLPAVRLANDAMSQLINYATKAGETLSRVFGLEEQTAAATSAADAYSELASSEEEAATAGTDNTTADFDKINKMSFGDSSTNSDAVAQEETAAAAEEATDAIAAEETQVTWLETALLTLKDALGDISGYLLATFLPAFLSVFGLMEEPAKKLFDIFSQVFGDMSTLIQPFLDFLTESFVPYIIQVFTTIGTIVALLLDVVSLVFSDLWNIAIYPFLQNLLESFLPALYDFGTTAWETLESMVADVVELFEKIWSEGIAPAVEVATEIWLGFMDTLVEFWEKWGVPIFDGIKETWSTICDLFEKLWDTVLKPIWDEFMAVIEKLWTEHLQPLVANFLDFVGTFVTGAMTIYNKFIAPIVSWFIEKFGPPVVKIIKKIIGYIGTFAGNMIDAVSNVIGALKGIINFLVDIFTGDWEGAWEDIKGVFSSVFGALVDIARTPLNIVIDIINKLVEGVVAGINAVINAINSIDFTVPDWIPGIGGKSIGFSLTTLTAPTIAQIPAFASGTVVPANYGKFLSILGDNTREAEVVSPLSTMKQAMAEVLAEAGLSKEIVIKLVMTGNLAALARILKPYIEAENSRVGAKLVVTGGA